VPPRHSCAKPTRLGATHLCWGDAGLTAQAEPRGGCTINRVALSQWTDELPGFVNGRKYNSVPIEEALIEVEVAPVPGFDVELLADLFQPKDWLPAERQFEVGGQMDFSEDDVKSSITGTAVGFRFRRSDERRVIQAQATRFVFSWLKPYDDWTAFTSEFFDAWERYATRTGASATTIAVRFINVIRVPNPRVEISDYLRVSIDVPAYLPQAVRSHFLQVEIPLPDELITRVISTPVQSGDESTSALLLDITVQKEIESTGGSEGLWPTLVNLREAKNYVFEACITDATRGLMDRGTS